MQLGDEVETRNSVEEARALEDRVRRIVLDRWTEVFELEQVDADQNFFDLGGNSLLAKRLIKSIEAALGCKIPFRTIFDAPTPAQLATRVQRICERPQFGGR